jgi:ectoine hydroxylase-related dioxygenase (phytanoyl-CoA dioxygenase family)
MTGVWIALEDVDAEAGPLLVYPGSHRLPVIYLKDLDVPKVNEDWEGFASKYTPRLKRMLADAKLNPMLYTARKGDILFWHANLAHGGSARRDKTKTRRSMVIHYFAQGAVAYYDSTGMPGAHHFWTED